MATPSASRTIGAPTISMSKFKIGHHPPDGDQLLEVLLAEHGDVRLHHVEELRDHRGHAAEVRRPRGAAQAAGDAVDRRRSSGSLPDTSPSRRAETARLFRRALSDRVSRFDVTRVAIEVFVGAELQRVDEDRGDDDVGALPRLARPGSDGRRAGSPSSARSRCAGRGARAASDQRCICWTVVMVSHRTNCQTGTVKLRMADRRMVFGSRLPI